MTRTIWIPAHPRRMPARADAFSSVHAEMFAARQFDLLMAKFSEWLEQEFERGLAGSEE